MKVSVCIPSYNLAAYIGETIQSVLNQTFGDYEILIEDDGSTDDSAAVIAAFNDPRIVFTQCAHEGHNERTNSMVRRAQGEYIALLPADDVWEPEKLARQVAYLDANPDCGVVFGRAGFIDKDGAEIKAANPAMFEPPNMTRELWRKRFMIGNCVLVATSLYRRSLHEEIGYFDETLPKLSDLEFWLRIVQSHDLHIITEPLAKMRMRGTDNLSAPTIANLQTHAGEIARIRAKYRPKPAAGKKFYIATPFYEMKGYSTYIKSLVDSLTGLAQYAKETGITFQYEPSNGDSYVWRARNSIAAKFLASDCSHLIFIDSDESWEPEGLLRLMKAEAMVVGAAYPLKNQWEHYGVTIKSRNPDGEPHIAKVRDDGLIYAEKVPTGFMKIAREVFERIERNEPENWYWENDGHGSLEKRHNFFGHILHDHTMYGEDISFNMRWQAAGGEVFVEPRVTIGHWGVNVWFGNFDRHLRSQPGGDLDPARIGNAEQKAA